MSFNPRTSSPILSVFMAACLFLTLPAYAQKGTLVWADEFSNQGLPLESNWGYEKGFVRNKEVQYYQAANLKNTFVEDGLLNIQLRKSNLPNPDYSPDHSSWRKNRKSIDYTSASVISLHKHAIQYGRVEVSAKLPQGLGVWPAIWMMGENREDVRWPACGEIDIMEFVGKDSNFIYAAAHYPNDGEKRCNTSGGEIEVVPPYHDFHTYALEWSPDRLEFYYDDTCYHRFEIDSAGLGSENPFRKPFYLLINLAAGGNWSGPLDESVLPQRFQIDYVRVYEFEADKGSDSSTGAQAQPLQPSGVTPSDKGKR